MENKELRTGIVYGYFDVRDFETKQIKKQGEPISVKVIWDADKLPQELAKAAQQFQGKDGKIKASVRFKIKACHWYDKDAKRVTAPEFIELDDIRFRLDIVYRLSDFNGGTYAWINAIQFMQAIEQSNPFTPMDDMVAPSETPVAYEQLAQTVNDSVAEDDNDLPF